MNIPERQPREVINNLELRATGKSPDKALEFKSSYTTPRSGVCIDIEMYNSTSHAHHDAALFIEDEAGNVFCVVADGVSQRRDGSPSISHEISTAVVREVAKLAKEGMYNNGSPNDFANSVSVAITQALKNFTFDSGGTTLQMVVIGAQGNPSFVTTIGGSSNLGYMGVVDDINIGQLMPNSYVEPTGTKDFIEPGTPMPRVSTRIISSADLDKMRNGGGFIIATDGRLQGPGRVKDDSTTFKITLPKT
jgi:hypothetical protein